MVDTGRITQQRIKANIVKSIIFYGTEFQEYVKYNRNAVKLLMKITQAH